MPTTDSAARPVAVIAHRGASQQRPENTIAAFRRARELGADWVELDVRRAVDGALVVHHDARLADGRALVALRRDEIPGEVPSLEAALEACAGMGVNIEIKNWEADPDFDPERSLVAPVVESARRLLGPDRVLVSSFDPVTVADVHAVDPVIPTALLVFDWPGDPAAVLAACAQAGHVAIHPWDPLVDEDIVRAAHAVGLAVNVWTVDDPVRLRELAAWGVDGLCTNVPDVALATLGRSRLARLGDRPG